METALLLCHSLPHQTRSLSHSQEVKAGCVITACKGSGDRDQASLRARFHSHEASWPQGGELTPLSSASSSAQGRKMEKPPFKSLDDFNCNRTDKRIAGSCHFPNCLKNGRSSGLRSGKGISSIFWYLKATLLLSFSRVRLIGTPWSVARQAPLSMGFFWTGLRFPSPTDLPDPGIKPVSPALAGGFFTPEPLGKPKGFFQFSSVQSLSHVQFFVTPWTAAYQASLSITNSWGPPKPMSVESVMPSNHLILCCPLLLLPSILPSIRVFSDQSAFHIRWPKYWSFTLNISPSNEHPGLISFRMD